MSNSGLGESVERFIAEHIHSVDQLEVLLLLQRTHPRAWRDDEVSRELRTSPVSATSRLADLARRGLLTASSSDALVYTFSPASHEVAKVVCEVRDAYASRHIAVINFIFSKPASGTDAARRFADAFDFRKKGR